MSENEALVLRRFADAGDPEAFAAIVRQYQIERGSADQLRSESAPDY